ncbi:hypothetical protein ACHAW6_015872 [Cyclotella cf. meneghiniana]
MKKSGGLVIGMKKKKKPIVVAASSDNTNNKKEGRPFSPNTVVNGESTACRAAPSAGTDGVTATIEAANNVNLAAKPSKNKLVIKPFREPPSLPPDFYEASLSTLQRAAVCVLRREVLLASNEAAADGGNAARRLSREELYRTVQDLIVHGYGKELYLAVVRIMNQAAGETVASLLVDGTLARGSSDGVGYDMEGLIAALGRNKNNGTDVDCDENKEGYREQQLQLLKQWHSVCRISYAEEYLTFVRSIFLVLDRAFVFLAEEDLEIVDDLRIENSCANSGILSPPKGKVTERSTSFGGSAFNSRVWGLWEVGIACLRRHMMRHPKPSDMMIDDDLTSGTFSVLSAMLLVTTHALLSEFDDEFSSNQTTNQASSTIVRENRPLIRNCVRTCIDLGALAPLLEELIVAASARFQKESKSWARALKESKKTAAQFLLHVENRLRQSSAMTTYYLPSNAGASVALRQLSSRRRPLVGSVPTFSTKEESGVTWGLVNSSTRRILPAIIETELISSHLLPGGILHTRHLYPMLDDCDDAVNAASSNVVISGWKAAEKTFENAKRLYGLCWRITAASVASSTSNFTSGSKSALDHLCTAFSEYGRLRGSDIVKQGIPDNSAAAEGISNSGKDTEKTIIPDLLAFKSHLTMLHTIAFRSDEMFAASMRSVLEDVCNGSTLSDGGDGGSRIAELLAKHVDVRFKDAKAHTTTSVSSVATDANVVTDPSEAFQNDVMALFRHVHSKDVFEAFYKRDLAKRLLTGRSVSSDMERSFLSKLKAECGTGYTSKMEGMFKDMELSRDIMISYTSYLAGAATNVADPKNKTTDMDVQVLTTGYWPVYPLYPNIILPPELLAHQSKFESYYKNKYQGRRIAWQYSLGNCIVKAYFPKQPGGKELIINLCQTLVLLCFQYDDGPGGLGLTIDDIVKKTGIDDRAEVERVLQSLSLGRDGTRVLIKVDHDSPPKLGDLPSLTAVRGNESPTKPKKHKVRRNVGPHDRFLFNASFTSNQRRIRITNITMKETAKERSETHEAVSKDRLYLIDAAVVRIMKARKTIDHRDLMGEVMAQLKFPSSSSDVKKRVESLIEREYMERVEGNRSRYNYLA